MMWCSGALPYESTNLLNPLFQDVLAMRSLLKA